MARRSRRQRRKGAKKSPPPTAEDTGEREMGERTEMPPDSLDEKSTAHEPAATSPALDAPQVPPHSLGRIDEAMNENGQTNDQEEPALSLENSSVSASSPSAITIGMVGPDFDEPESSAAHMLSPIAVSKEVRDVELEHDLKLAGAAPGAFDETLADPCTLEAHRNDRSEPPPLDTEQSTAEKGTRASALTENEDRLNGSVEEEDQQQQQQLHVTSDDALPVLSPAMNASFDKLYLLSTPQASQEKEPFAQDDKLMDAMNESAMSASFAREDEIARTQEELGATSLAFLHRLRGAAFRRKKALVHSRDDMVAKERSHRRDIEAARLLRRQSAPDPDVSSPPAADETKLQHRSEHTFKARPAPNVKFSGSAGVPKVEKRPATVPQSPLLGLRRLEKPSAGAAPSQSIKDHGKRASFTALPLPKTTGEAGHGGQSGLPKVPKRPVTEAVSPLLGLRRGKDFAESDAAASGNVNTKSSSFKARPVPKSLKANGVSGVPRIPSRPTTVAWSPLLGFRRKTAQRTDTPKGDARDSSLNDSSKSLMGESLLSAPVADENNPPKLANVSDEPEPESHPGYEPRSTVRANKRAEYDAYLAAREKERIAEESRRRMTRAKELKRELAELRKGL